MKEKTNRLKVAAGGVRHHIHLSRKLLLESCTLAPSNRYAVQFVRSMVVSVLALVVDFGGLVLLKQVFGVYYLLAATISFCVGVLINYYFSVTWVFATRKLSSRSAEFIIFVAINALGLLFNLLIIAGMVDLLNASYITGKAVSTVVIFFWNFLARKKILY